MPYFTQNREMRRDGVWNFTLPAWVVELPDGSHFNVCPNAGACAGRTFSQAQADRRVRV